MRRPTSFDGIAVEGISRLDPFALPVSFAEPLAGKPPGAATSAVIDIDRITVSRPIGDVSLPVKAYRGIAARMSANADTGTVRVVLELNHRDPTLTLTLASAEDPADLAADWLAWSRALRLPMLIIDHNGMVSRPDEVVGAIKMRKTKPRRMHSYFSSRRPRFLARRKTGWIRETEIVRGEELIARR
jgi:hypothetical protein